jgi:hypothetical protein
LFAALLIPIHDYNRPPIRARHLLALDSAAHLFGDIIQHAGYWLSAVELVELDPFLKHCPIILTSSVHKTPLNKSSSISAAKSVRRFSLLFQR